jgi:hypothetical protein
MADCLTRVLYMDERNLGTVQQDMETGELTLTDHDSAITDLNALIGKTVTLRKG